MSWAEVPRRPAEASIAHPTIDIVETFDVVLAQIVPALNLDESHFSGSRSAGPHNRHVYCFPVRFIMFISFADKRTAAIFAGYVVRGLPAQNPETGSGEDHCDRRGIATRRSTYTARQSPGGISR